MAVFIAVPIVSAIALALLIALPVLADRSQARTSASAGRGDPGLSRRPAAAQAPRETGISGERAAGTVPPAMAPPGAAVRIQPGVTSGSSGPEQIPPPRPVQASSERAGRAVRRGMFAVSATAASLAGAWLTLRSRRMKSG